MTAPAVRELAIQDYFDILRRRWKVIFAILLLAAAGAAAATVLQETTYQARAEVLIRTGATNQLFPSASNTGNRLVRQSQAELTYLRTDAYRAAAAEQLGRTANVSIGLVSDRDVVDTGRISFTNVDLEPERAAEAAQTYAQAYIDARNAADVEDIQRQLGEAVLAETSLSAELEALRTPIDEIDASIARTTDPTTLSNLTAQRNLLLSQLGADVGRLESGVSQAGSSVEQLTGASIVITDPNMTAVISSAASVPTSPISTGWVQNLLIALAVGSVLGIGAALLRETMDNRVHSDEDIEALLDLPVIGHVGTMTKRDRKIGLVVNQPNPDKRALEAYRKIRSSIMFLQAQREIDVIQVTSPVQGNGKTTVAGNLAVAFAQQRQSVLLIDADLRRPQVHKRFLVTGLDDGLSSVLAEDLLFADAVRLDMVTGVYILPAGKRPPNPSELLGSEAFQNLYKVVRSDFDIVIIDTPPLLPVTDARLVAAVADAVILVADPSANTKRELTDSVDLLHKAGATTSGVVLNRAPDAKGYGHTYGHSYEEQ
ncbi:MAG: polysaccharide biosynthesis tyrosine autokinase [Acidimicrobiia bacterium]|nr:polysaccharide biosynthesis tyrosine autokinase [Acidimicrobiia bacterium]